MTVTELEPRWSSSTVFLLAAMGTTIGLGNIWRFPFIAGESGGGAFILVYIAALLLISIPVMVAELHLGHSGRGDPVHAIATVATDAGRSPNWGWIGHLMAAMGLLYLFYYPLIGSWALHYVQLAFDGTLESASTESLPSLYAELQADKGRMISLHTLFLPLAALITALGVQRGLEKLSKIAMPLLLLLLFSLVIYAAITIGLSSGLAFLFTPDFSKLSAPIVLAAIGQALFSTAVGQGVLLVYSGYLKGQVSLGRYSAIICLFDGFVAITAGVFIFSIVAAFGLAPTAGEGLVYMALPLAFADMPGGEFVGTAFFLMLALAAFTSVVPTVELLARWCQRQFGWRHSMAALIVGVISWFGGLSVIYAQSTGGPSLLRIYDYAVSNLMIPISALAMAVFVGWFLPRTEALQSLNSASGLTRSLWINALRFIAPLAIVTVLLMGL